MSQPGVTRYHVGYDEDGYQIAIPNPKGDWIKHVDHLAALTRLRQRCAEACGEIATKYAERYRSGHLKEDETSCAVADECETAILTVPLEE